MLDDFKNNDVKSFEEIYQAVVLEFRKKGLLDPTREEVQKLVDYAETQVALEKVPKQKIAVGSLVPYSIIFKNLNVNLN